MALDLNKTGVSQSLIKYLRQQRENHRFVNSLEITITFAVVALFGYFAIKPTVFTISSLVGDIKAKEELTKSMKTKINNLKIAQDNYAEIQGSYGSIIDSSIPIKPDYGDIANQIEGSAAKSTVTFEKLNYNLNKEEDINTKKAVNIANINQFSVFASGKNTFDNAVGFISHLLNNRRMNDIVIINFSTDQYSSDGKKDGRIQFGFTTNFFNFKSK